jgi:hypothetical protein
LFPDFCFAQSSCHQIFLSISLLFERQLQIKEFATGRFRDRKIKKRSGFPELILGLFKSQISDFKSSSLFHFSPKIFLPETLLIHPRHPQLVLGPVSFSCSSRFSWFRLYRVLIRVIRAIRGLILCISNLRFQISNPLPLLLHPLCLRASVRNQCFERGKPIVDRAKKFLTEPQRHGDA